MNFLAHLYLSGQDPELIIGNFIGDFVKGSMFKSYPERVQSGILLHREIDSFTDSHPTVKQSTRRLHPKYHHYAGVIIDVFYDHYLAANWSQFSVESLSNFTNNFYALADEWNETIPQRAQYMLKYMRADNWLLNYQFVYGVNKALTGMSRRTKFESGMDRASGDLELHYDTFKSEFDAFFPELIAHSQQVIKSFE